MGTRGEVWGPEVRYGDQRMGEEPEMRVWGRD